MKLLLVFLFVSIQSFAAGPRAAGTVAWFDLQVTDSAKAEKFYGKLLNWKFQEIQPGYKMISVDGNGIGGLLTEADAKTDGALLYFQVESLKESFQNAVHLGAKAEMDPTNITGFGSYAILRDPFGNRIALFSEKALSGTN